MLIGLCPNTHEGGGGVAEPRAFPYLHIPALHRFGTANAAKVGHPVERNEMGQQSGTARKAQHQLLADEGLSVREISEKTGHPKSTVHRDLSDYEPPTKLPDPALADTDDRKKAAEMKAEADRLTQLQRERRGWVPAKDMEGKPCLVLGPCHRTPEMDATAREIGRLRKDAARLLYPTPKPASVS